MDSWPNLYNRGASPQNALSHIQENVQEMPKTVARQPLYLLKWLMACWKKALSACNYPLWRMPCIFSWWLLKYCLLLIFQIFVSGNNFFNKLLILILILNFIVKIKFKKLHWLFACRFKNPSYFLGDRMYWINLQDLYIDKNTFYKISTTC